MRSDDTRQKQDCCARLGAGKGHAEEVTCQVGPKRSPGPLQTREEQVVRTLQMFMDRSNVFQTGRLLFSGSFLEDVWSKHPCSALGSHNHG